MLLEFLVLTVHKTHDTIHQFAVFSVETHASKFDHHRVHLSFQFIFFRCVVNGGQQLSEKLEDVVDGNGVLVRASGVNAQCRHQFVFVNPLVCIVHFKRYPGRRRIVTADVDVAHVAVTVTVIVTNAR